MAFTPLNAISPEYSQEVNNTAFKILKSLYQQSKKIALGKETMVAAVTISKEFIDDEINELKQFIEETVEDAKDDALDIEPCLNRTNIRYLNVDAAFNKCKMPVQFKHLEFQKEELAKVSGSFPEEVNLCILSAALLQSDLERCLDRNIQQVEKKLIVISATIEAIMTAAIENSSRCTELVFMRLDTAVNKAAREFEDCADEIEDTYY